MAKLTLVDLMKNTAWQARHLANKRSVLFKLIYAGLLYVVTLMSLSNVCAQETPSAATKETWYPFLKDGKWGFIDSNGDWKIQPSFGGVYNLFNQDIVRVFEGREWGYIKRSGEWLIKPQFNEPLSDFSATGYQVVMKGKKMGIINRLGAIVLPAQYDDVVLSSDRAWIRKGKFLGVFGFDGKWIHKISIPWPSSNGLPMPVNSDGVAWFQKEPEVTGTWGLISEDGTILFKPQFAAHDVGRHEEEAWDRPEGSDFQNGQAWVLKGKEYWSITKDGKILERKPSASFDLTFEPPEKGWVHTDETDSNNNGTVWVSYAADDHHINTSNKGWILTDFQGKILTKEPYIDPGFIVDAGYRDRGLPKFLGNLACVASVKTYLPYGDDRLKRMDWGYIDSTGRVVAWHTTEPK